MPAEKKERLFLPSFQADQGILHSPLVEFGHVLVHIGVVVTNIPLCTSIGYCPKSERWRIVMRSLELEGAVRGGKGERKREKTPVSIHSHSGSHSTCSSTEQQKRSAQALCAQPRLLWACDL